MTCPTQSEQPSPRIGYKTPLPFLFDPLSLALSILIIFFKKNTNISFSYFLYSIYRFSFYLLYNKKLGNLREANWDLL